MQPTGVDVLDRAIGGLVPGLPLVIAGGPGSGRTVLSLELARRGLAAGDRVLFITTEPASALVQQADCVLPGRFGNYQKKRPPSKTISSHTHY